MMRSSDGPLAPTAARQRSQVIIDRIRRHRTGVAVRWLRNRGPFVSIRLLRALGAEIGNGVTIKRSLLVDNAFEDKNSTSDFSHLHIGDNVYVGDSVYFDLAGEVWIEENAVIAGRANFVTHLDVNRSPYLRRRMPRLCASIRVGAGASVSFNATMLAGSALAADSALGAGALLLQHVSTSPKTLWGGVPARELSHF